MNGMLGLELSLSSTVACWIPPEWNGLVESLGLFEKESERRPAYGNAAKLAQFEVERCLSIAEWIVKVAKDVGAKRVCVREYGKWFKQMPPHFDKKVELGGIVKSQIYMALGLPVVSIVSSSARKWLLGRMKRGNQKEQVKAFLLDRMFYLDGNQIDAFVTTNYCYDRMNGLHCRFSAQGVLKF
jgi:hypothetical protein